jgi:diguanylate cyclase (GGDEF)-like protein/PAS domain S-box-containing protein
MFDRPKREWAQWLYDGAAASSVAVVAVDADAVVREWGAGAVALFGITATDALGRRWRELGLATDDVQEGQVDRVFEIALAGHPMEWEWTASRPDGDQVAIRTVLQPLPNGDGRSGGALALSFDLSSRERFERDLVREAMHDPLTGLPNRTVILDELARVAGSRDPAAAVVLFVDLDGFKAVNDLHGHAVGDSVLIEVGARLRASIREGDLVGRLSGDEFVLVCRLGTSPNGAADLATRVVRALSAPVTVGHLDVDVSASVGVLMVEPGDDPEGLLHRADRAMYSAKGAGKGTYHVLSG